MGRNLNGRPLSEESRSFAFLPDQIQQEQKQKAVTLIGWSLLNKIKGEYEANDHA